MQFSADSSPLPLSSPKSAVISTSTRFGDIQRYIRFGKYLLQIVGSQSKNGEDIHSLFLQEKGSGVKGATGAETPPSVSVFLSAFVFVQDNSYPDVSPSSGLKVKWPLQEF